MNNRGRAWIFVVSLLVVCGLTVLGVVMYRSRFLTNATLIKRLPAANALLLYIDFDALRRAGILQILEGAKATEDPEYQNFVHQTDFNWKQDLDGAFVSFAPTGNYLIVRGRFDWPTLRSYVNAVAGNCYNTLCRMAGSTPERKISFLPLQSNVMAMAVSADESAAVRLETAAAGPEPEVPNAPVWLSIPSSFLKNGSNLPDGTLMFAHSMEQADAVTLGFVPEGNRLAAKLEVRCRNDQDAVEVGAQLTKATALLRTMIERERQTPNPADLSGVLTSGTFKAEGKRVFGYWPIERAFVTNMLGGK